MRSIILLLTGILFTLSSHSQNVLTNEMLNLETKPRGKFNSYVTLTGDEIKVGDTLTFGKPSGVNGKFVYLQSIDIMGTYYVVGSEATNSNAIIKAIRVSGTKRAGFKAAIQTKGISALDNYFFHYEDALGAGELKSDGYTEDEALEELKKAKTKLDLEIITQEEYDSLKKVLMPYLK